MAAEHKNLIILEERSLTRVPPDLKISNYSDNKIKKIYSVEQSNERYRDHHKPRGLWLSIDGEYDWAWWAKGEQFRNTDAQYQYRIHLKPGANIKYLTTVDEILAFTEEYCTVELYPDSYHKYPDWGRVTKEYQGIIIAPYQWELRLDPRTFWYYSWDCASGVLWNADAVEKLTLVRRPKWFLWDRYVYRPAKNLRRWYMTRIYLPRVMKRMRKDNPFLGMTAWDVINGDDDVKE